MVLEKLKKYFRKKPQEEEKPITLGDAQREAESLKEGEMAQVCNVAGPILKQIRNLLDGVKTGLKELADADVSGEVYPGIYKSGVEGRRLLVNKISRAFENLRIPKEPSLQNLQDLKNSLILSMNQSADAMRAHGQQVKVIFGEKLAGVAKPIHELQGATGKLRDLLETASSRIQELEAFLKKIDLYGELKHGIPKLQAEIKSAEDRIRSLAKAYAEKEEELKCFEEREDFKELTELLGKQKTLEHEIQDLKNSIHSSFSTIARPLRKMRKMLLVTDKSEVDSKVLDYYLNDPLEAFISEGPELPRLNSILKSLRKLVESGEIELDQREKRKTLAQIDKFVGGYIKGLHARWIEVLERKEEVDKKIRATPVTRIKAEKEELARGDKLQVERAKAELEELKRKLASSEQELKDTENEIREKTRLLFNKKIGD